MNPPKFVLSISHRSVLDLSEVWGEMTRAENIERSEADDKKQRLQDDAQAARMAEKKLKLNIALKKQKKAKALKDAREIAEAQAEASILMKEANEEVRKKAVLTAEKKQREDDSRKAARVQTLEKQLNKTQDYLDELENSKTRKGRKKKITDAKAKMQATKKKLQQAKSDLRGSGVTRGGRLPPAALLGLASVAALGSVGAMAVANDYKRKKKLMGIFG